MFSEMLQQYKKQCEQLYTVYNSNKVGSVLNCNEHEGLLT